MGCEDEGGVVRLPTPMPSSSSPPSSSPPAKPPRASVGVSKGDEESASLVSGSSGGGGSGRGRAGSYAGSRLELRWGPELNPTGMVQVDLDDPVRKTDGK
jgi:hypothetical protein